MFEVFCMPLSATTVKADAEKLELAKLQGINISKLFRDALDTSLRIQGDDKDMLESQLTEIRKQMEILQLEEKLILDQLKTLESLDVVEAYRMSKYDKWKKNLAYQITHNTIDWDISRKLLRFSNVGECKIWIIGELKKDGLI